MLQLRGVIDGHERQFPLHRAETRLGRGDDNDVILTDRVTSLHHALITHADGRWWIRDEASRYGLRVNGDVADETELEPGDVVTIGTVDFTVENVDEGDSPGLDDAGGHQPVPTLMVTIDDFAVSHGMDATGLVTVPPAPEPEVLEGPEGDTHAYSSLAVGHLSKLAQDLRTTESIDEAARRTLAVAFDALPIDRGWMLFTDADGTVVDRIARIGDQVQHPEGELPISQTIVRRVLDDRVSLGTGDANLDGRNASESMVAQNIRAAMCAPLWSGQEISGVIYVDSLQTSGAFTESALDLLTAMANYAAVAVHGLRSAHAAETEREARRHLERYHSPTMIEALSRQDGADGVSRLRQADVTVLFADVVGFSSLSEELTPDGVARLLDGFFTEAVEAVFAHGGTLDKFIGDAVMAFFGAPVATHDHAEQALRAALDLRFRLSRWNKRQVESGGQPVEIRVALNSGPVVVGDVGSSRRVDYTVLGNTVNVAARLEGVGAPGEIVLGPGTRDRLPADFPLERLGEFDLKGLRHPVPVWRVAT